MTEIECGGAQWFCPGESVRPTRVSLGYYTIGGFERILGEPENTTRVAQVPCPVGHVCANGIIEQCSAGKFGVATRLGEYVNDSCESCPAGYFCPGGTSQYECGAIFGLVTDQAVVDAEHHPRIPPQLNFTAVRGTGYVRRVVNGGVVTELRPPIGPGQALGHHYTDAGGGHFGQQAASSMDLRCVLDSFPLRPLQAFEFSLSGPSFNDLTKLGLVDKSGISASAVSWDHVHMAWRTSGNSNSFIATGWKPGPGAKAACFWKRFWSENLFGLDGFYYDMHYRDKLSFDRVADDHHDDFFVGTYWSYTDRIYANVGGGRGSYASAAARVALKANEWVFMCITSGGGDFQVYVATPDDGHPRLVKYQQVHTDAGPSDAESMTYGTVSTFATDAATAHTWQAHSKALYGGFAHFDAHLTAEEVDALYEVMHIYYPGHGGQRGPEQIPCAAFPSNVGAGTIAQKDHFINKIPTVKWTFISVGAMVFQHFGGSSEVFCPQGSGVPRTVKLGYYSTGRGDVLDERNRTRTGQQVCPRGSFCRGGKRFFCPQGRYGASRGMYSTLCTDFCRLQDAINTCPTGSIRPGGTGNMGTPT